MSLYRGAGGASDATDDSTVNAVAGYASAAASSASAAATSATNASNSATAAASSASSAASSASSVATNASNAASSAGLANTYATAASASKDAAAASATTASTKAGQASSSASEAGSSASTAAIHATNASNSASAAAASASDAATSASNAADSAADALAIYGNTTDMNNAVAAAATSAVNAATSAAEADDSRVLAEAAVTGASSYASAAQASANDSQAYAGASEASKDSALAAASDANTYATNAGASASDAADSALEAANSAAAAAAVSGSGNGTFVNTPITTNSTVTLSSGTANGVAYLNGSKALTTGSALTFDGSLLNLAAGSGAAVNAIRIRSASANTNGFNIVTDSTTDNIYLNNFYSAAILFGTGNTERMRLTSTGNLGLGVTPSAWASGAPALQIGATGSIHGFGAQITISAFVGLSSNAYIVSSSQQNYITTQAAASYSQYLGAHRWYTAPSGTAGTAISFTQAMTLDASGNLGVGTTSPSYKLHVTSATPVFTLQDSTSAAGGVGGTINFIAYTSGTSGANLEAQIKGVKSSANAAGELQFFTSTSAGVSTQRAIIDGSGNVGIGTSSPASLLDVASSSTDVVFSLTATGVQRWQLKTERSTGKFLVYNQTGASTPITLTTSGDLGIGTSSPSAKLHVYKSNQNQLQLQCDDTGQVNINMGGTTTPAKGAIYFSDNSGSMWFNTASTQRMTLDASGNLLVGMTSVATSSAKTVHLANATAPTANPTGGGVLYVEGGALKFRGSSGTVTTIAPA